MVGEKVLLGRIPSWVPLSSLSLTAKLVGLMCLREPGLVLELKKSVSI